MTPGSGSLAKLRPELLDQMEVLRSVNRVLASTKPVGLIKAPGYKDFREVGRGGMGEVYRTRQISLDRDVAVKLIKRGLLTTNEELSRFRNECGCCRAPPSEHRARV